ncbi:unnamed protein product, partial [Laminaria digitata]
MYSRERSYEYVHEQVSHHEMFVLDTGCWLEGQSLITDLYFMDPSFLMTDCVPDVYRTGRRTEMLAHEMITGETRAGALCLHSMDHWYGPGTYASVVGDCVYRITYRLLSPEIARLPHPWHLRA